MLNTAGNQKNQWYIAEAAFVILAADKMKNQGSTTLFIPTDIPETPQPSVTNLALNKAATSSRPLNADNRPPESRGNDGDLSSAWFADGEDNQWWAVDLGTVEKIDKVVINWEGAFASGYTIQVSVDNVNFINVFSTTTGEGGDVTHSFDPIDARYVKLLLTKKGTVWEMTFWEFEVYN